MTGVEESLVPVSGEPSPPGVTVHRCVLCNCKIATKCQEDPCSCEIDVCPNSNCPAHMGEA